MDVLVMPTPLQITTTPTELRKLADEMEAAYQNAKLGQSTLVCEWLGTRAVLQWHFDFSKMDEAKFVEMQPHLIQKGDVIQHCGRAYEVTRVSEFSETDQGYWVGVKSSADPIFCPKRTSYKVRRQCATSASTSKPPASTHESTA